MGRDILVTGASGQVGGELVHLDWPEGTRLVAPARGELDLADAAGIEAFVQKGKWAAIINCGAYTAVDKAETEVAAAWRVNALAPAILAAAARDMAIPIVHVSTDYVFDGAKPTPYEPADPTGPLNVYGASKLGGELAVRTVDPRHVILRASWVVSPRGSNFLRTMLRLGRERSSLRIVSDQHGRPTIAADLALAIRTAVLRLVEDPEPPIGTFHFANAGETTWHGFAQEIFRLAGARGAPVPSLTPITTDDYPTPARRPAHSVLSTVSMTAAFGLSPRPWQEALAECMEALPEAR
jgi:dTDP-4-dehydrorhamnose reductase